ncbi:MAG: LysM peptidoglycan-binding domain-containing protein [Cyclobacteriaceae bacterium]|nr:LysM peptidoglycan-binding domain-containing protein [Cyclobacteriaceae bacterium]
MKLTISEGARKQIQADVDALHRNQTYLKRKIEKVDLYFPIIERVFREENLPDDFKYLTIQESALVSDAVSSANAVGFWQFKEASAIEVGLRVDRYIDERMHITASSRGAAKYLKKNNFFFNNWIYALLAYNTGPGGAKQHINNKYLGKNKMEITKKTHWYVKKFLAHKIAFENEIHKNYAPSLQIYEYKNTKDKSLKDLSDFFEIDHQTIVDYNKWLRRGNIPSDKTYIAIIPVHTNDLVAQNLLGSPLENGSVAVEPKSKFVSQNSYKPISAFNFDENQDYPKINKNNISTKVKINGIYGFIASYGKDLNSVISEYGISKNKFLKYNDMTNSDRIDEKQVYYLKAKKSKAKIHYHIVLPGENAWSISQKYGIKIKKLLTKNRMKEEKDLSPGMVMWLRFIRPADVPVEYKKNRAQNVLVKSIPNEMEYPQPALPTTIDNSKIFIEAGQEEQNIEEDEFLFEEINDDTNFINENSYVDLKKETEKVNKDNMEINTSNIEFNEGKNIKKEDLYHIVKMDETLFSISRAYDISVEELRQWNFIEELDKLSIGQRLLIKKTLETNDTLQNSNSATLFKTYKVKQDDTLYGIARKHNISIKELMELNNKNDFTIKEGESLKIKTQK